MKISNKPSQITSVWAIVVLIFGIISAAAVWKLTDRQEQVNDTEKTTKNIQKTPEKPQKVTINLPKTEPIEARKENYRADDSLWRLVNKSRPLNDKKYRPLDLKLAEVPSRQDKSTEERSVRQIIMNDAKTMFADAATAGYSLIIGSGYRGYDLQNFYYSNYVKNYGQAEADTFSAKPGYSEHQTGLVMDIATSDQRCYLEECFGETAAGKWLAANAHNYGFILRYPANKQNVTDFHYEPWHFRYVGRELAAALYKSGLTLDEADSYLEKARQELLERAEITE